MRIKQVEALIQLDNVSMEYEGRKQNNIAISDISLSIFRGEFVTVVGPSGCGKSTLLKIIAGYQFPTTGQVLAGGEVVQQPHPKRGVVFQDPTLYPWLTISQNIEYGLRRQGQSREKCKEASQYLLEEINLLDYGSSYPSELSGGMKQRVAFARTLATQPEIILLDEPFSALDIYTRIKMQDFLRKMWLQNQQTMLFITHDIEEALSLGTRVIVMDDNPGKIVGKHDVDFTNKILSDPTYDTMLDPEFNQLKRELFQMIAN